MSPYHDALAPPGPTQAQGLSPHFLFLLGNPLQFPLFLFFTAFHVFVLPRGPLLFAALLQELGAVLLEGRDCEERELVILGYLDR